MPSLEGLRRLRQFCRYCVVGGSGVAVDMAVLHALVAWSGWPAVAGKLVAAQTALLSNFFWNDVWTFRGEGATSRARGWRGRLGRLGRFQAICVAGIGLAAGTLHGLHGLLGWNLYLANLLAIGLATGWNYGLNAWLTWPARLDRRRTGPAAKARETP